jgi:hypothetical protein
MSAADLSETFAGALLDPTRAPPDALTPATRSRFAIHRNNLYAGLIEALAARHPVCRALVGPEFFAAAARVFVELSPPLSPILPAYGDDFGDFLEGFAPAATVPYLADVARLEAARARAANAADATPLLPQDLLAIGQGVWERARVVLHPSLELVSSPHPILTIWEAHQESGGGRAPVPAWRGEDVLVARPDLVLFATRLPPGGIVFLDALQRRATIAEAHRRASTAAEFDLVQGLAQIFTFGLLVAVEEHPGARPLCAR